MNNSSNQFNFFQFIASIFSLVSLIISFIALWTNRKYLDVVIENNLGDIEKIFSNYNNYKENLQAMTLGKGKTCFIKIINPSPKDIGFFDLKVIDIDTSKPIFFLTKGFLKSLGYNSTEIYCHVKEKDCLAHLNCPSADYGILKSNSFTKLDVSFFPTDKTSTVLVSFKVAISRFPGNKKFLHRKKFKYYEKVFTYSL